MISKIKHFGMMGLVAIALSFISTEAFSDCLIIEPSAKSIQNVHQGICDIRETPASTFKLALAVMGYNANILKDANNPVWQYKKGYPDWLEIWKGDQTPKSWIANSVVWYSQVLTRKIGRLHLQNYLKQFEYGNESLANIKGQDGLTYAWLNGALLISPDEQAVFLRKVAYGRLIAKKNQQDDLKQILWVKKLDTGWSIYGKTGTSSFVKNPKKGEPFRKSWFIGWAEKDNEKVIFVRFKQQFVRDEKMSGLIVKDEILSNLPKYLTSKD